MINGHVSSIVMPLHTRTNAFRVSHRSLTHLHCPTQHLQHDHRVVVFLLLADSADREAGRVVDGYGTCAGRGTRAEEYVKGTARDGEWSQVQDGR